MNFIYFLVPFFFTLNLNCKYLVARKFDDHAKTKYVRMLNDLRLYSGWNRLEGIVIKDDLKNKWDVKSVINEEVNLDNLFRKAEHFVLLLACRYKQRMETFRSVLHGFGICCIAAREWNFVSCIRELDVSIKSSHLMLKQMTKGLQHLYQMSKKRIKFIIYLLEEIKSVINIHSKCRKRKSESKAY